MELDIYHIIIQQINKKQYFRIYIRDFRWAIFSVKYLKRETLTNANLEQVDLTGVDLTGADLRWAVLVGADFIGVNLEGIILSDK